MARQGGRPQLKGQYRARSQAQRTDWRALSQPREPLIPEGGQVLHVCSGPRQTQPEAGWGQFTVAQFQLQGLHPGIPGAQEGCQLFQQPIQPQPNEACIRALAGQVKAGGETLRSEPATARLRTTTETFVEFRQQRRAQATSQPLARQTNQFGNRTHADPGKPAPCLIRPAQAVDREFVRHDRHLVG